MKYYVFTAANIEENKVAIKRAKQVVKNLERDYTINADITGIYEGSTFEINLKDENNTSICVEDNDILQLIKTCMDFAREEERLRKMED